MVRETRIGKFVKKSKNLSSLSSYWSASIVNKMKIILICLVFSTPLVFGIMDGEYVENGTIKFMASIRNKYREHFCSGVLITSQFVMTAATCVRHRKINALILVVGITYLKQNGTESSIEAVFKKEATGENKVHNNIALLRLTKELFTNEDVQPINLPPECESDVFQGETCYTYGWGQEYVSDVYF